MMAAIITTPIDVIKTKRQMTLPTPINKTATSTTLPNSQTNASYNPVKLKDIFQTIVREEGYRGFTKGLVPRVVKVAPACAVMISSYEWSKKHLQKRRIQAIASSPP